MIFRRWYLWQRLNTINKHCSKRNIKIAGISLNQAISFNVFKEEFEKVASPKYEILNVNSFKLAYRNNNIEHKICQIIEKCIYGNKAKSFIKEE